MDESRSEYKVLGRVVGTATGWDEVGDPGDIILYDLVANPMYPDLPSGDVAFMMGTGVLESYDEEGEVTFTGDIITVLTNVKG